jgi:hypothetical protein
MAKRLRVRESVRSDHVIGEIIPVQGAGEKVNRPAMGPGNPASFNVADSPDTQPRQRRQLFLG